MQYQPDLESEYDTGDQPRKYRERRGKKRPPSWGDVENWRSRWTQEIVIEVLHMLGRGQSSHDIGQATGFGTISIVTEESGQKDVADLRGLDLAQIPPERRALGGGVNLMEQPSLDFSYASLEGARLTGLDLRKANLYRANLKKATLRRVNFTEANLSKAHLEDADMREAVLENANLGHIRYTEDAFWWRGTVFMETHIDKALYVDPFLERCAKDQYYLYVVKYRNRNSLTRRIIFLLWWILCNYGKSPLIWAGWSILFALAFSAVYYYYLGESAFAVCELQWSFPTAIYYSVVTFTTLGFGDVIPKTQPAAWWVMAEVIVGYVMLGGLISIFATKLARRS